MEKEKSPKKKKLITNLIRIALLLLLLFFGFMLYAMIDFRNKTYQKWDTFDDKRIADIEKYLDMTIPDDADPVWFRRASFQDSYSRLIVEGIDDPQEFLYKAFPDIGITEYTPDEKDSSNDNEKKNELQKIRPDNARFSGIKSELNSAIEEKGYTIEFTEIYDRVFADRIKGMYDYYIGFGETDSGYCAVIRFLTY